MCEYFQLRIDQKFDPPLEPGETLLDRVFRLDADKREKREQAKARRKGT